MKVRNNIILLAIYIFVSIALQNTLVLCVRAGGQPQLASANHWHDGCCNDLHDHFSPEATNGSLGHHTTASHDHCCDDYPVPVLPQLAIDKDCVNYAQTGPQISLPVIDHFNVLQIDIFDRPIQAPSHINTFILLI